MKQRTNQSDHEMRRESHKFQRGETGQQRKELADILSSKLYSEQGKKFAIITADVLQDEFGEMCDMKIKETPSGFIKICMNKKGVKEKSVPQIEITITKDFKFNIHLNDYENYEDYYYYGEKLTSVELMDETRAFKAFLEGQSMSENSKLEKIEYRQPA